MCCTNQLFYLLVLFLGELTHTKIYCSWNWAVSEQKHNVYVRMKSNPQLADKWHNFSRTATAWKIANIFVGSKKRYRRKIPTFDARGKRGKGAGEWGGVCDCACAWYWQNICLLSQWILCFSAQLCVCAMHTGRVRAQITHTPHATRAINHNKMLYGMELQ